MTGVQLLYGFCSAGLMRQHNTGRTHLRHKVRRSRIMLTGGPQEVCKSEGRSVVMSELDQLVFGADYANDEAREKIKYLEDHVCPDRCMLPQGYGQHDADTGRRPWHGTSRSSTVPAVSAEKERYATQTGRRIVELVKENIKPKDILTREALNGVILTMALAGSTNAVLHLLSIKGRGGGKWQELNSPYSGMILTFRDCPRDQPSDPYR